MHALLENESGPSTAAGRQAANLTGAFGVVVADALAALGGGGSRGAALVTLATFGGESIEQLRRALGLSQPGAVRLVDRLVAEGLARRGAGTDGRTRTVTLSSRGEAAAEALLAARQEALATLLAPLEDAERDQLAGLLAKVLRARGAAGRDPRRVCRLCARGACPRCPVAAGADEVAA